MTAVRRVLDRFWCHGTVTAVEGITPRMRRIRITGESLRGWDWTPGQHIRVQVGDLLRGFRDALRTYSIWDYDHHGHIALLGPRVRGPGNRRARRPPPAASRRGQPAPGVPLAGPRT